MRIGLCATWTLIAAARCQEPSSPPETVATPSVAPQAAAAKTEAPGDGVGHDADHVAADHVATKDLPASEVYIPGGQTADGTSIKPFYLDATETTIAAYSDCVADGVCAPAKDEARGILCTFTELNEEGASSPELPVNCVTRAQAIVYCEWADKRLPTGAELRWAAAGGEEGRSYPWGESAPNCSHGNFGVADSSAGDEQWCGDGVEPVASYPAGVSVHGAFDLEGNLSEWISDISNDMVGVAGVFYGDNILTERGEGVFFFKQDHRSAAIGIRCARDA